MHKCNFVNAGKNTFASCKSTSSEVCGCGPGVVVRGAAALLGVVADDLGRGAVVRGWARTLERGSDEEADEPMAASMVPPVRRGARCRTAASWFSQNAPMLRPGLHSLFMTNKSAKALLVN